MPCRYIIELESLCVLQSGNRLCLDRSREGKNKYDFSPKTLTEDLLFEDEDEDVLGSGFIVESVDWEYEEVVHRFLHTIEGFKSQGVTEDPSNETFSLCQNEWANVGR